MQNYRLTLAYDGTRYRGWQRLPPPAKTVQASVETALGEIFGQPLEISGSGRTDAGVHAACQVASFHAPKRPTDEVLAQLKEDGCGQALLVQLLYGPLAEDEVGVNVERKAHDQFSFHIQKRTAADSRIDCRVCLYQ